MIEKPRGNRGAAYIRVSDGDKQDPQAQRNTTTKWAENRGKKVARFYEDVEGRNSRDRAEWRINFQRLIKDVERGLWDWILVDSLDRFGTRDSIELGYYLQILRRNDCELWTVTDGHIDIEDIGTIFKTTASAVTSQLELKKFGERQVSRKRELASRGEWQGGYVPYGFDVVSVNRDTGKENLRVVIKQMIPEKGIWHRVVIYADGTQERCDGKDRFPTKQKWEIWKLAPSIIEDRIKNVVDVFRLFASGAWSVNALAKRLNQRKVDPVYGEGWYATKLSPMLRNPVYYLGQTVWGKVSHGKNAWYVGGEYIIPTQRRGKALTGRKNKKEDWIFPKADVALIEQDLWEQVQDKLDDGRKKPRALRDERLWLSGLLYCGRCGCKMVGWTTPESLSYKCSTYSKFGKANKTGCRLHRVQQDKVEVQINRYLDELDPEVKQLMEIEDEPSLLSEIHTRLSDKEGELRELYDSIRSFLEQSGIHRDWNDETVDMLALYNRLMEKEQGKLEKSLAAKTEELKSLVKNLTRIPEGNYKAMSIAKDMVVETEREIAGLEAKLLPFHERLDSIFDELKTLDGSLIEAREAYEGNDARAKAMALRKVISKVVLNFTHYQLSNKDPRSKGIQLDRSVLESVRIEPVLAEKGLHPFLMNSSSGRG